MDSSATFYPNHEKGEERKGKKIRSVKPWLIILVVHGVEPAMAPSASRKTPDSSYLPTKYHPNSSGGNYPRLQAQRLRWIREARGLRRGVAWRMAERQRRVWSVRLWNEEDGGANWPKIWCLYPPLSCGAVRRRPSACAWPRVWNYSAVEDVFARFY